MSKPKGQRVVLSDLAKIPNARVVITLDLEIDAAYLKAVGVNADTAATLIAEAVRDLVEHEDYGSTIWDSDVSAIFSHYGKSQKLKLERNRDVKKTVNR